MISCHKCQMVNAASATVCAGCGTDLLPGETFKDRLFAFILGLVGCGISIGMFYFLWKNPDLIETSQCCLLTNPVIWIIGIFFFPISGMVSALRKTPVYQRYENRAKRHLKTDWEQSVADFTEAIKLAPKKQQAALLKQRSEVYKAQGAEEEFLEDRLAYMESEGAYEGQAGFAKAFKLDPEQFVASARDSERKQLVAEGKIHAVGFCKKCQKAVDLNAKLRCPTHRKPKPLMIKTVLPKNYEQAMIEVQNEGAKQFKKKKTTWLVVLILGVVLISLCVIIPILVNALQ